MSKYRKKRDRGYKKRAKPMKYGLSWGSSSVYYRPGSHYTGHMIAYNAQEEIKFVDNELVNEAMTTSWTNHDPSTTDCLSATATGDTESSRDGRIYYIHSIDINGRVGFLAQESVAAPISDPIFRIIVVVDKQTNGAQLTATDVMDAGQTDDFHAFRNMHFTDRFHILYDNMFSIRMNNQVNEGAVNLFANGGVLRLWEMHHTFKKPLKVLCSLTTAVIAAIETFSIHVIAISSTTNTDISYQSRCLFSD